MEDCHFTVMGFTALTGDPVMCVVIFEEETPKMDVATGVDVFAWVCGDPTDADFVSKNSGPGRRFPMVPTCKFRGIDVPCFVRFSASGGIDSSILTDIVKTFDHLNLLPRMDNVTPFTMMYGHGRRFQYNFLQYICDNQHKWAFCIGVPYGTSLWQVGGSKEKNGS